MAAHEVTHVGRGSTCVLLLQLCSVGSSRHHLLSIMPFGQPLTLLFRLFLNNLSVPLKLVTQLLKLISSIWFSYKTLLVLLYPVVMYLAILLSVWKLLEHWDLVLFTFSENKSFLVVFVCFICLGFLTDKY